MCRNPDFVAEVLGNKIQEHVVSEFSNCKIELVGRLMAVSQHGLRRFR